MADDTIWELERQTEKASLFYHTVLTEQIARQNESDTFLYSLIDYLTKRGFVLPEELLASVESVKKEITEKNDIATLGVTIRKDDEVDQAVFIPVNCEERLHLCKSACCKLTFSLSIPEIEEGELKWDLGKPYFIRHQPNGYCHHINAKGCCKVYDKRPSVCRQYSCANDERIWIDFEKMIVNEKWIEENLGQEKLHLIQAHMIKV